jgi:serine/threonine-protein kinase RsbW
MDYPFTVKLSLPAIAGYVSVARLTVAGIASRMNFTVEDIEDIKVAVSEACTNVVLYAYKEVKEGLVDVTCTIYEDQLEMEIKDDGCGFDPKAVKDSKVENEDEEATNLGLGLAFIDSLMDECEVVSTIGSGTTVRMVKSLSSSSVGTSGE